MIPFTDVGGDGEASAACFLDLIRNLIQPFAVDVNRDDLRSLPREQCSRGSADSRSRAGNDGRLSLELHLRVAAPVPPS